MTRAELIQYITDNVYPNARNEVTAPMVRDSLLEIVDFLGDAATYNIGMVASGNQGLVTGGNVNTAIALALLPYYTAAETGQAIDDAIARIGLGQAAYKDLGQVADGNTGLVMGGQVYSAINAAITSAIKFQGVSDTPLTDGSTTNPIQIDGQYYTAKKGDMVVYAGNEFLWVGNKWQQMGDESSYALKTISISGTGYLTGGGDLTQNRTLDISATAKGYIDHGEAAYNYFSNGVLDSTHLPSMYIGTTSVQFSAVPQNLTGISSVRATTNVMTLFEWDSTNSAWHFHGNIYTDGWFSGGGISSGGGGGGGGGIDPVAMWRLLTNDPSLTQYDNYTKISAEHINFPVTSVVGLTGGITAQQIAQALNLGSFAYKNSLSVSDIPDLSGTYLPLSAGADHALTGDLCIYNPSARSRLYLVSMTDTPNDIWFGNGGVAHFSLSSRDTSENSYYGLYCQHPNGNGWAWKASFSYPSIVDFMNTPTVDGHTIYHAGNSNKSDVPWTAQELHLGSKTVGELCAYIYLGTNPNRLEIQPSLYGSSTRANLALCAAGGNVGFGNTNPSYKVDVTGDIRASGRVYLAESFDSGISFPNGHGVALNSQNEVLYIGYGYRDAATELQLDGGSNGILFRVYQQNKMYIGQNNMTIYVPLNVSSSGNARANINLISTANVPNDFFFGSNGTQHWSITSRDSSEGNLIAFYSTGGPGYTATIGYSTGYWNFTQRVGVKNANPAYEIDVTGIIHATTGIFTDGWFSGGGLASSSDRRLKKNIKNFAYTPKLLLAIRPREWDWKDGSAMAGHAAGFVAQEIEPIMPYAVDDTRNFKALFYDRFHALEISALQDHERRIKALENEVKQKDKEIASLKKRLNMN